MWLPVRVRLIASGVYNPLLEAPDVETEISYTSMDWDFPEDDHGTSERSDAG